MAQPWGIPGAECTLVSNIIVRWKICRCRDPSKFVLQKTLESINRFTILATKRIDKTTQKKQENEVESTALKAEADHFIKYLICFAGDQNIANITDNIVKMSTDNKSMFDLIMAMELQVIYYINYKLFEKNTTTFKMIYNKYKFYL